MNSALLSIAEAAALVGRSPRMLARWRAAGRLKPAAWLFLEGSWRLAFHRKAVLAAAGMDPLLREQAREPTQGDHDHDHHLHLPQMR